MKKWLIPVLFGIAIVALIILGVRAAGSESNDAKPQDSASPAAEMTDAQKTGLKEGQIFGQTNNPKVVLTEFADLQCPACKLYEPTLKTIREKYSDQVQIVFKHFPLAPTPHKNALVAAYASEAAANQGKFWDMHDKLYDAQDEWGEQADPKDKFVSYASAIGLNVDQFKKDYDGEAGKAGIERDKALGTSISLKGTPSFFINGVAFDTTGGGEELLKQIDALVQQ